MTPPEIPSLYISPLKRNKITDTDGQSVHRCFFVRNKIWNFIAEILKIHLF